MPKYNPERNVWRGRSYKRGGETGRASRNHAGTIREMRDDDAQRADAREEDERCDSST